MMKQIAVKTACIALTLLLTSCSGSGFNTDANAEDGSALSGSDPSPDPTADPAADTVANPADPSTRPGSESAASYSRQFVTFESGQVRPLALSADGTRLFATNTPNATLEILSITDEGLHSEHSVPVGLEPVAVALFGDEQAWVVNHLSDSISVVTTAHRGQNGPDDQPIDAQLLTPSVGRADVWVFDAEARGNSLGGDPLSVTSMFGDTPGALTVSPDGRTVYVAVMHSGNRTTVVGEGALAKPGPVQSSDGALQPDTGLIVKFDGSRWRDDTGAITDLNGIEYDEMIQFSLPDYDVFALSATRTPSLLAQYSGVGTTLFNMATNPMTGTLYVSNTDANNLTRFEGEGRNASTVRGNIIQSRITLIDDDDVTPVNLNKHLDHTQRRATDEQRQLSIAQPLGMAVSNDGSTLYVAGFGSDKIAIYDTNQLSDESFEVARNGQISVPGGPTAVVLDESRDRLYAMTRFNNSVATIDTGSNAAISSLALYNPEPASVQEGRPFLYNASLSSSHGDASCGACHIFGDVDGLAWDLGNPDATVVENPNQFVSELLTPAGPITFHPMKGPMTSQSLRGLANNGPMHWRGDRTGAGRDDGQSLEHAAFTEFNGAFVDLLGADAPLSEEQMSAFADFALEIQYPPNPIRALDNSLSESQAAGQRIYMEDNTSDGIFTCNECHRVSPENGQFGTAGESTDDGTSQEFKVPHLRNMYQKVGKFGNAGRGVDLRTNFGEQIRGFGYNHDGNVDTIDSFLSLSGEFVFDPDPEMNTIKRRQVIDFVMAMGSELAPIVGQQITIDANSDAASIARLDLLLQRAAVFSPREECDLIAKGVVHGTPRGFVLTDSGVFQSDREMESFSVQQLRNLAQQDGAAITFTCVPPGSGVRMGIDQDSDGISNGEVANNDGAKG